MLTFAGVAVGHIAGYGLAHPDGAAREVALGGHAYFATAASVVVPLGVFAALGWAVATARTLGMRGRIDVRRLIVAQVVVFAVQEIAERAASGAGLHGALVERGVWFGLLAQVAVAVVVVRGIDLVGRVVRFAIAGPRPRATHAPVSSTFVPRIVSHATGAAVSVGLRAPPAVALAR